MYAEQPHRRSRLPVAPEEFANFREDLSIELGRARRRVRARDGGEIRVAQLELDRTGFQTVFAQPPSYHLAEPRESRLQAIYFCGVLVERVLVTDGFRPLPFADLGVVPRARILAVGFAGQREAPLSEALFEERFVQPREVAHFVDAQFVKVFFHDLADARHSSYIERRQKRGLRPRQGPQ